MHFSGAFFPPFLLQFLLPVTSSTPKENKGVPEAAAAVLTEAAALTCVFPRQVVRVMGTASGRSLERLL